MTDDQNENLVLSLRQLAAKERETAQRVVSVAKARTEHFVELFKLSGLDPSKHCRFTDWSEVSFADADLRGFDFTGARLVECDFSGALIKGARFDQAEIDRARPYGKLNTKRTKISAAKDWDLAEKPWKRSFTPTSDSHLSVGAVFQDAPFAPELVVVPAGSLPVSSNLGSSKGMDAHNVGVEEPIAVGRFTVTEAEWAIFLASEPSGSAARKHPLGNERLPAVDISWNASIEYVSWLSEVTGKPYRLLSADEWEYCCRAGTRSDYSFGDSINRYQAMFSDPKWGNPKGPSDVGSFPSNAWGLFEMHGNVWEWCSDAQPEGDGFDDSKRLVCGGSFVSSARDVGSNQRRPFAAEIGHGIVGLRIARQLIG